MPSITRTRALKVVALIEAAAGELVKAQSYADPDEALVEVLRKLESDVRSVLSEVIAELGNPMAGPYIDDPKDNAN